MRTPPPREDRLGLGVVIALIVFLFFTLIDTSAKWLALAGYPPMLVVFSRYFFHAAMSLVWFLPTEGWGMLRARRPDLQLWRTVFLAAGTIFNFFAVKYLPLSVTISIFFASPMLISLLSIPILGERIGSRRFAAIVVGFCGVLVITQPWSVSFQPAMLLSLAAVTCASLFFVMTRKLAGEDTNATSQIWSAGIATVALIPVAVAVWETPQTYLHWAIFIIAGLFGFFGHALMVVAYRYAEAVKLAPVVYSQIFYATALGWLVFGTVPTASTAVGAAIIIASGLYIWARERQLRQRG